jgi:hypothetical protein
VRGAPKPPARLLEHLWGYSELASFHASKTTVMALRVTGLSPASPALQSGVTGRPFGLLLWHSVTGRSLCFLL